MQTASSGCDARLTWGLAAALAAVTLALYGRTVGFEFVNYDDLEQIAENPQLHAGLTADGIAWALTSTSAPTWQPTVWLSFLAGVELHGMDPGLFHLTNALLHAVNAAVLFVVLRRMTGATWRSVVVAALFAVHPLHVESVAWVSSRKDVLSGLAFVLTLGCYAAYSRSPSFRRMLPVALCLMVGLATKPTLVPLPLVLLLLDYWPLARTGRREPAAGTRQLAWEKIPLVLLSVVVSIVAIRAHEQAGVLQTLEQYPLDTRIGNALLAPWNYLGSIFWPTDLTVPYLHSDTASWPLVGLSGAALVVVTWAAFHWRRRLPFVVVGWLWFILMWLPVSGFFQIGRQSMADRWMYLPAIGIYIAVTWSLHAALARSASGRIIAGCVGAAVLSALIPTAWMQVGHWRNSVALFRHNIRVTGGSGPAHNNLATALYTDEGRVGEAIEHLELALRFSPNDGIILRNLDRLRRLRDARRGRGGRD